MPKADPSKPGKIGQLGKPGGRRREAALRADLVAAARQLVPLGLTTGTSGNVSVRCGGRMLITPSAVPYDDLTPDLIAAMPLDDADGARPGGARPDDPQPDGAQPDEAWAGHRPPSSEWRFHRDILRARPDLEAVVHAHSPFATTLAVARREIPAIHYMIAAFGGPTVRCAGYARFGTQALSDLALAALEGRCACLLANHGMIVAGPSLTRAMWLAVELETLAMQHWRALQIGGGVVLSDAEIAETIAAFAGYGAGAPKKTTAP